LTIIGYLIKRYKLSRFYGSKNGRKLGKCLGLIVRFFPNRIRQKKIGSVLFELDIEEIIDSSLFFTDTFEPEIEKIFQTYSKPGMTIIDVGANIGYHSLKSAEYVGPTGKVISIEPSSWAIQKLQRNIELNPQVADRILIIQSALSNTNQDRTCEFFQASYKLNGKSTSNEEIIDFRTLDWISAEYNLNNIGIVKIDVDGTEIKVLLGALQTIEKHHPILIVEFTPTVFTSFGENAKDLILLILDLGYLFYTLDDLLPVDIFAELQAVRSDESTVLIGKYQRQDN
jgi:FkbM family methyltransferase